MNSLKIYFCPICGNVTIGYGNARINCCGKELQALAAENCSTQPTITEMDGEYLLEFDCPMTKEDYIAAVVAERYDQVALYRMFPEQSAQVRLPQVKGVKLYAVLCRKEGVKLLNIEC